jgi:hypothetical protein
VCFKIYLETRQQTYRESANQNVIELRKKQSFKKVEGKLLSLKIYPETGQQTYRESAYQNLFILAPCNA